MNIWIFNHYAITPDMPGGTRHYDFGRELVKRGYKVTIFASSFHYSQHKELKLTQKEKHKVENIDGINFVWLKSFPYQKNDWRRVLNMISYMHRVYWLGRKITKIDKNIKKPDIIIGSSVHLLAVLSAFWLAQYYKAKFTMEARDLWPQTLVDMGRFKEENLIIGILRVLERFLYRKAKKIIVLMPFADKYISSLNIKNSKIVLIPNGVDLSRFQSTKKQKEFDDSFKVMYLGAHGKVNALEVILDAAKIVQDRGYEDILFFLYGDGSEKEKLIRYKKKIGAKILKFCDPLPKEKIPDALSKADILIDNYRKLDILKYGISHNKLYDYMASGKPVILTSEDSHNVVNKSECGLTIPFEQPELLANAILKLYQLSPNEKGKMGQRGRNYVEKYHNIPILVNKLEKIIKEVNNEQTNSKNN